VDDARDTAAHPAETVPDAEPADEYDAEPAEEYDAEPATTGSDVPRHRRV
jgi:hypothetical protein